MKQRREEDKRRRYLYTITSVNTEDTVTSKKFESATGWDVVFSINRTSPRIHHSHQGEVYDKHEYSHEFLVEVKTTLGDEYPRVLREMKSRSEKRGSYASCRSIVLLYHEYTGTTSLSDVKQVFSLDGLSLIWIGRFDGKKPEPTFRKCPLSGLYLIENLTEEQMKTAKEALKLE